MVALVLAMALTLDDSMRIAVERSPEVRRAQADAALAGLDEPGLRALLDPEVSAGWVHVDDRSPQLIPAFLGTRTVRDSLTGGLLQRTLIGTELGLKFQSNRADLAGTDPRFLATNPAIAMSLGLEVRQPILKNFWGRPDRARIAQARSGAEAARLRLGRVREEVAARAGEAFLEYLAVDQEQPLRHEAVADAARLLARIAQKRRDGFAEDSDVAQAEAHLELRRLEADAASAQRSLARLRLLAALSKTGEVAPTTEVSARAPDIADAPAVPVDEVEDTLRRALAARKDLAAVKAREKAVESKRRVAVLQKLPSVGLLGSIGYAGLSDAYGASFSDLGGFGHRVYAAGVQASVPLGSRRERIPVQAIDSELEAVRAERAAMEERIRLEVQAALEQAAFARRRAEAAGRLVELSQNKLSAEEKNYARGRSSTEILIRFAEEVRQARREQLRARVDLARTALALRLASGRDLIGGAP